MNIRSSANRTDRRCPLVVFSQYDSPAAFSLYINILAFFLIYSCLGWCVEVVYAAATTGQLVNRGFLNGPVCPIYGFGMILVLFFLTPLEDNLLLLYLGWRHPAQCPGAGGRMGAV
ncbi:MAG: putative ABC transporter permease [Faecalibacterium prausnitzii]